MKKLSYLLIFLLLAMQLPAQLFQEDFGTTFSSSALSNGKWASCRSTSSNSSTGACAGSGDYGAYIYNGQNLTTIQVSIPSSGYCLTFNYSFNASSGFPKVQAGTGAFCSTASYTDLQTLTQTATCDQVTISLDAWAGQTIWIRFLAGSAFTSFYIDDVEINNTACGGGGGASCSTTVFSDGFSDNTIGAPEWSSTSFTYTSTGTPCNGGDSRAYFSTFSSPAQVVTQNIDLTGATYAEFSLDYYMSASAFSFQCATVEITTNGGSTWNNITPTYTDPDGSCQHATQDISAYTGNLVQIRISRASTSYTFYFDNVEVCTDGGGSASNFKWADNFNDNDLVLDFTGNDGDEDCPACGTWTLGGGASLNLVPSAGWNGNSVKTEAFPANMSNVYYVKLDRNEYIESPVMDLSGMESFKISFYAKSSSPGTGGGDNWTSSDRLKLQIWNGSSWITINSLQDDLSASWNNNNDFVSAALPFNYYCFSAYKSTSSPGNYYYSSSPNVNPAYFHSGFKFRVIFEGGFSGSPFAWVDDFSFRADADGYSTMIPCGLSFWNEPAATAYGQDGGTSGNNNAEKGVELELDNSINIPPNWATEANDGDVASQVFGVNESERVVFAVISEQEINFAFPKVHFYSPSMGWQSSVMSRDNNYTGPGWLYYAVEYISCDLAGGSISEPTDEYRYYFSFEYGNEFIPVFYQLNTSGIEYGGGVTSFAETFNAPDMTSSNGCGLLPVEWVYFELKDAEGLPELEWRMLNSGQGDFTIEISEDGLNFNAVATLPAAPGESSYATKLQQPVASGTWFRVRYEDISGEYSYSPLRQMNFAGSDIVLWPNPATGNATVKITGAETVTDVTVCDIAGRELLKGIFSSGEWQVPLAGLKPGVYFVALEATGGTIHKKLVIE